MCVAVVRNYSVSQLIVSRSQSRMAASMGSSMLQLHAE